MSELYKLPRVRFSAEMHLGGRQMRRVCLFLADRAETHLGHERPSELFNSSGNFLPALERDELVLLNLHTVLRATYEADLELGPEALTMLDAALAHATRQRVNVTFDDGTNVRGDLSYVMPEGQRRIQDYLNRSERFFALYDGGLVHLIQKSRVVLVTPL